MTILIGTTKAIEIANIDEENNPLVFWENVAASTGTLSTDIGTEVEAASLSATGTTYDPWVCTTSGSGNAALKLVLSSSQSFNCVALVAHNAGTLGASVRVQYSTNSGSSWTNAETGTHNPTDDQAILFYFDDVDTDYWRIVINGPGSTDVEVGVVFWGNVMTLPQRIYQGYTPPIRPTNVMLQSNVSEGGNLLGAAVTKQSSSTSAELTHISPTFIRGTDFTGFMDHFNEGRGFFWAWRPTKYGDVFYAWRSGNTLVPTNSGPREFMSFGMGMRFYDQP